MTTYIIFEKGNEVYHLESTLPIEYTPPHADIERILKDIDRAAYSLQHSKNAHWDSVCEHAIIFHTLELSNTVQFVYSGLKYFFLIKTLEKLGFKFTYISSEPEGYPLEEVR